MKRAAVVLVVLALAAPAAAQAPAAPPKIELAYTQFTLPDGLRVILHEDHSIPMVSVNMWYHVGSARELPKRTGFAHLFEHLMFMGSGHVKPGEFDEWLEAAGGDNNGSTENDRTNYWINVPANSLELALFLESDRMGYLLESMTPKTVDAQRDVVKNERRQSYENRPYGMFYPTASKALYPEGHPYSWPTIGSMTDLSAATKEDVEAFFRQYYVPNNAVLVVAGDVRPDSVYALVRHYFGGIPRGNPVAKPDIPVPALPGTSYITLEDRVSLPQVNLIWRTGKAYSPDDAAATAFGRADSFASGATASSRSKITASIGSVFAFSSALALELGM